jgi:hypothetical protein
MVKRWKPVRFALVGAWLGVGFQIATMPAVLAREDLQSIIGGMVGGAVGGAVLAAVAAIIQNRITRAE